MKTKDLEVGGFYGVKRYKYDTVYWKAEVLEIVPGRRIKYGFFNSNYKTTKTVKVRFHDYPKEGKYHDQWITPGQIKYPWEIARGFNESAELAHKERQVEAKEREKEGQETIDALLDAVKGTIFGVDAWFRHGQNKIVLTLSLDKARELTQLINSARESEERKNA